MGVENFCTKLPKGTPLRQIWSNKSFGECRSDVVLTQYGDEKKNYVIAIGNSMSSITLHRYRDVVTYVNDTKKVVLFNHIISQKSPSIDTAFPLIRSRVLNTSRVSNRSRGSKGEYHTANCTSPGISLCGNKYKTNNLGV